MSLRATLWALDEAPVDDPQSVLIVVALADEADDNGRGAAPGIGLLTRRARCSSRTVRRRLAGLLADGVITLGDQRAVMHIRADRRPTVYNLAMGRPRGVSVSPREDERDDSGVTPQGPRGDTRGDNGVTLLSPDPHTRRPESKHAAAPGAPDTPSEPPRASEPAEPPSATPSDTTPSPHTVSDRAAEYRASLDRTIGPLRDALTGAGLDVVRWDLASPTELAEIAELAATRGVTRLVRSAQHQVRQHNDSPPGHVAAWLPGWRDLRPLPAAARPSVRAVEDDADATHVGKGRLRGLFDAARSA